MAPTGWRSRNPRQPVEGCAGRRLTLCALWATRYRPGRSPRFRALPARTSGLRMRTWRQRIGSLRRSVAGAFMACWRPSDAPWRGRWRAPCCWGQQQDGAPPVRAGAPLAVTPRPLRRRSSASRDPAWEHNQQTTRHRCASLAGGSTDGVAAQHGHSGAVAGRRAGVPEPPDDDPRMQLLA